MGVLLRSVASSISVLVACVMVLPDLASGILSDDWDKFLKCLPEQAAASVTTIGSSSAPTLSSAAGAIVLTGWVVVALLAAAIALARRDV